MQDLVCDEQRSINGSTEQINSFSSNLNVKMHNKKMNFPSASNCKLSSETLDFGILMLSKSKSDVLFPIHYANCTTTYNDRVGCLGDKSSNYLLSVSPINYNTKLLRSVSDSEGLNNYKNVGKTGANRESYQVSEVFNNALPIKINIPFHAYNNTSGTETVYQNEPTSYLSLSSNESCSEICQKDLERMKACNYENEGKNNLSKTKNPTNIRITSENGVLNVKQSSSAYLFEKKEWNYKAINGKDFSSDDLINKTKFSELISDAEACDSKQKDNRRRNTLSCIQDFDNSTMQLRIESIRGKSVDSYSELDKWTSQSEQEFHLSREKDEMKFSSFPNLSSALANHKAIFKSDSNSKNHKRSENSIQSSQETSPFLKSSEKSEFLRRILQSSVPSELFSRRISRANEDKFLYNGSDEIQNERKLAMPTSKKNHGKSPFLSKFLNDLENRTNTMNGNFSQLRYSKSSLVPGKQPKLEKRSQSFLQLLSLKRIQEAEKEIEKVEKEVKMDEDSAGSLLEALKTHGYKGVLSQRFQGNEDSSQDGFNRYNSTGPFLIRKNIPEFSGLNYMYYDNAPQFTSSNYDVNNLDMINDLSMKSFEMYSDFRQNSPKQFVSDWLAATNHNGECSSPLNADLDSYPESEMFNSVKKTENASCFGKRNL
ncbi:NUAK family SNF1-like kinase 1 [Caerostris extrusa]|uniref:NUAK family SNF1-like kinase 1 n=1 Tax=Caerostris extrusa TaxID=172846 RepID=A0AAV4M3Q1_CAEEX|nr:NUAK family SNF1-like kinase 1 [Caerostris extrusa]